MCVLEIFLSASHYTIISKLFTSCIFHPSLFIKDPSNNFFYFFCLANPFHNCFVLEMQFPSRLLLSVPPECAACSGECDVPGSCVCCLTSQKAAKEDI